MIPDINLLPKIEKGETSLKLAYILVGILSLLTLAVFAWIFFNAESEIADSEVTRTTIIATRDALQGQVSSAEMQNNGSLEESVTFVESVSYAVSPIIIETRNLLPLNTYLRSYVFSETGVEATVDFETLNSISSYVSELKKSLYFNDVQVGVIEAFEIITSDDEKNLEQQFAEVPRYELEINLVIDKAYLAAGGDEQ
ncbi:malate synthase [Solibacillus sp. FSL K6-4121]|uniref:malate synthase n=1 Tax=Solibacillus sp. FSL K6-4121 TaxID=2921505 RepID=UPI0030F5B3F6